MTKVNSNEFLNKTSKTCEIDIDDILSISSTQEGEYILETTTATYVLNEDQKKKSF
jgi:hypothetical protein